MTAATRPDPGPELTPELIERVRENICTHCGGAHARACPRVKAMSYHPNGALAGVEFWPDGKWSVDHILFPDELSDPEGAP